LFCAVTLAIAAVPGSAFAGEPGDPSAPLPQVPRLELVPPRALLLAQASPPPGGSKSGSPGAATASSPAAPPPAATPAAPLAAPPAAPAPGGAPPPESGTPAAGGPPPGAARPPPYPYPYPPYPYAYPIPLTPPTLPYDETRPIPPNYKLDERSNKPLVVTGFSLFALAYGISLGVSTIVLSVDSRDGEELAPLLIPVVGPFITMATFDEGAATLALNGITQTAGLICILVGSFATEKVLVRIDPPAAAMTAPEVLVGPGSASLRWRF
jgi:hypothetical protein